MTFQKLALALAFTTVLALAGCSSDDSGSTTTGDGTTGSGTTGSPTSGSTTGSGTSGTTMNGTNEDRTCTATAGGPGSGFVGAPGVAYVGGCPFGSPTETATIFVAAELPADCDAYQTPPGAGPGEAVAANIGNEYPAGTGYSMFCGAGGTNLTGKITLQAVPA